MSLSSLPVYQTPGFFAIARPPSYNENWKGPERRMIEVTPKAVNRIREMLAESNEPAMRLGVVGGGCSGLSYKFKFETDPRPNDNVIEADGVRLFVDPKSFEHLDGLTLDFTESLLERAFVFHNPNATESCGCGKSFGI